MAMAPPQAISPPLSEPGSPLVLPGSPVSPLSPVLSEPDMVRIAADLVFAIMRAAQASSYQIRSLGELFIECDKNGDGGISFVELLQWVKNDLKVAVTDWQLDEFGKHMGWREICKAHPLGHIDQKGFYGVVRSVWRKVKWYFSNAVVYGVSKRDTQKRRHAEVLNIMDELRDPLQRLIQQLVVKGCHIHQFFASFDAERTQQISTESLAKVFAGLGIVAAERADELSLKACLVANYLTSGFPTENNGGGEFARQDTLEQLQKENGQTFHYAAMCELGKQGPANATMGMADADFSLSAFGAQPSFVMIDEETSCESTDVMMDNTVTEGIARTIRSLGITLMQLQDLVLEFFSEFTLRMDLNVLAEESRDKLIFRHLYFAVCGVFEAQTELQPVANIFTLFAKYAERDTGHLHPYGFQQLLKRELCISVTEHEVVTLHSMLSRAGCAALSLDEFAGLLKVASDEATKLMCSKLPQGFAQRAQAQQQQQRCLSKEAAHALAKLILRVLQGEAATFEGFFRGLPQLRPSDSSFSTASKDGPRYPDELAVGMRRVGVVVEPPVFETLAQTPDGGGGGGGGGAMRWEPRPSFLTKEAFLGLVWHVFVVHVQPAFTVAATWQEEATRLAGRMRAAMYQFISKKTALGVPARDQVGVVWDALPKDAAGQVPVPAFVNAAVVSCAEMYDGLDDERTLVDPAEAKTVWQEGRPVEACVRQILHLASVSGSVTQEQAGRIFLL